MQSSHFRSYYPNQTVLFPQRIDENIAGNDPVRLLSAMIDSLDITRLCDLYCDKGCSPYHPRMMLKVVIYGYMNNIYSCRGIEKALLRDVHFMWLSGRQFPDHKTINNFRNRVKDEIDGIFTQLVLLLADRGFVSLGVEYIDGTKIESKANKYTFVWRKTAERNSARLREKIRVLLEQIDESIAQGNAAGDEAVEFTPAQLKDICEELRRSVADAGKPADAEGKEKQREMKRNLKELEKSAGKLADYEQKLEQMEGRNSMSKTDPDATFMRMKEDAMNNGQTKPGYNLQISSENQFITDFALFPNPTDTLTMIPFLESFKTRYGHYAGVAVADSGYGSEENYRFMEENRTEAFVKYNRFHIEHRPRYKPDPFRSDNFCYNETGDYYVCPMGQHMERCGTRLARTASGYVTESACYRASNCSGCPLRCRCYKAKGDRREIEVNHRLRLYKEKASELLCSEEGRRHRGRRCIEPEAVFGQMKTGMGYRRFRHFGKDKVTMDFAFFAIAFNIKKMCSKTRKTTENGGNTPPNGRFDRIFRYELAENPIFWPKHRKSAA